MSRQNSHVDELNNNCNSSNNDSHIGCSQSLSKSVVPQRNTIRKSMIPCFRTLNPTFARKNVQVPQKATIIPVGTKVSAPAPQPQQNQVEASLNQTFGKNAARDKPSSSVTRIPVTASSSTTTATTAVMREMCNKESSSSFTVSHVGPVLKKNNSILRRNHRSIHTSLLVDESRHSSDNNCNHHCPSSEGIILLDSPQSRIPLPVAEGLSNKRSYCNRHELEWLPNNTISIQLQKKNDCITKQTFPNYSLVQFSLDVVKVADRTRGYFMCPICNEPFCNPAIIACGHLFCMQCVTGWFEDQDNCPCCRFPVVMKDISINSNSRSILAKEYPQLKDVLISTLSTGNFFISMQDRNLFFSDTLASPLSGKRSDTDVLQCPYSENILNLVAPIFQEILQNKKKQNECLSSSVTATRKNGEDETELVRNRNNFIGALWYLRHGMLMYYHSTAIGLNEADGEPTAITNFPVVTREDAQNGSESSCESLVAKVMLLKKTRYCEQSNETNSTLSLALTNSRRKLLTSCNSNRNCQCSSFRFRMPSVLGYLKMLITGILFFIISISIYLFDDQRRSLNTTVANQAKFCKMDLFVFLVTIFATIAYTETERIAAWTRNNRRNGQNGRRNGGRRGRRRRNALRAEDAFNS